MKQFDIRTRISFGDHALDRLLDTVYRHALVVTDPYMVSSGMIHLITDRLEQKSIPYTIFSDIVPDPPITNIALGVKAMLDVHPDLLIGCGGGSAMDSAKAIREMASKLDPTVKARLIAIPTTSGTGSEVTSFAVVSDPQTQRKYPLVSDDLLPDEAILDVDLVKSVPASVTADTGMDVFTHALEAYVSTNYNEFSGALAEKAIELVGMFLLRSFLDSNDLHARQKMHAASCLAGLAFNSSSLGLNHGMAHQLGAMFHIPHGRANAILLPYIVEYNSEIDKHSKSRKEYKPVVRRYVNVAKLLGLVNFNEITTVRALVNWIQFMNKEMDIPLSVSQIGCCTREEYMTKIEAMADAAIADACTATNPRTPTREEVMDIYRAIW